ncbi:MAG TPA: MBL fold metallo-hydrolase [Burkholderiaceae bacterium]|nr:MBL fold metallo-hydrolase [Burkholderiaceae bacterium]
MLLSLEPLPASEGDCLLLHWGSAAAPKLAVIDGGPGGTYKKQLRKRLLDYLAKSGKKRLPIELVMVSHIDGDHIVGITDLFAEVRADVDAGKQSAFQLKRLWHNTFNDVLNDGIDKYYKQLPASLVAAVGGEPSPALESKLKTEFAAKGLASNEAAQVSHDVASVLASQADGRDLRNDHRALFDAKQTATLNSPFVDKNGKPTLVTASSKAAVTIADLSILAVGPLPLDIQALQTEFDKYIKDKGLTAEAVVAAYADKSVPNLSSIVCLATFGTGAHQASILFTGDARGDKIIEGLKVAGVLKTTPLKVDLLKVPHHGSSRNMEEAFFDQIVARHYVFSGNGKYGNPDRETLEWLTHSRGKGSDYTITLTYSVDEIDQTRKAYFEAHGTPWSAANDSLAPFLKKRRKDGYKFKLREGDPSPIELGDEHVPW